jgi:predicted kinase
VSSDRLRKELAGVDPTASASASYGTGIYAPAMTVETYDEMLDRSRALTGLGETVVLDATWSSEQHRAQASAVARETHSDLLEVRCDAPASVCEERIRARLHTAGGASDADTLVAERLRELADPWPQSVRVDTTGELSATVAAVTHLVRPQSDVLPRLRRPVMPPD